MSRKVKNMTPVHRFTSSSDIKFRFVTITEKSFEVPDVEHRHGYWTVFVFLKGKGRHVIDFKEVNIKPGSIHLVLPGQIHALHGGNQFLAYALMFTEEFFLMRDETTKLLMRLFRFMDAGEAVVFEIAKEEQEFFSSLIRLIQHEYEGGQGGKGTVLLDLLSVFVSKCSGSLQLPMFTQSDDDSLLYIQLRHEVEKSFKTLHTVAGYASLLHVSVKRLNELCRKYTDMSALEFIHARLVIESKRLLKFSDKPIKEIAYDLHFTDAAHFTNFFKQKSGKTPLDFRGR